MESESMVVELVTNKMIQEENLWQQSVWNKWSL